MGYELLWPVFLSLERWQEIGTSVWSTSLATYSSLRNSLQTKTKEDYGLLLWDGVQFLWSSSIAIVRYLKDDVRLVATTKQQHNYIGPNKSNTRMIILSVVSPDFVYSVGFLSKTIERKTERKQVQKNENDVVYGNCQADQ